MSAAPLRVLVVSALSERWTWLSRHFDPARFRWTFLTCGEGTGRAALMRLSLRAARAARGHDVVATHGPWTALFVAAALRALRVRRPHLAFTFNHGNGIFFRGPFLALARRVLPATDLFVTHSRHERGLLSRKYGIPVERIAFTHWAVAPPPQRPAPDYLPQGPFVCCIGRNNRDLPTFIEAVRLARIPAVLICGAGQADGLDLPPGLVLRSDVPFDECDAVLDRALASVVPLIDDSTGAGHMTVVTSLHYGTPVIGTQGPILSDYVIDGETGLTVPRGSPQALADAIAALRDDPARRAALSGSCRAFAAAHLSQDCAIAFLDKVLARYDPAGNDRSGGPSARPVTQS
ncbi:glycosyltransferase family 4 protein [Oceaniovalibus guishaninsula]|uniref:glycosyltransferase family 4 protein n=1 Tax=Oceaniovalibus guishaninsula TaxID=1046117 RepID=UPI00058F5EFE|nr:glycosyltransferase family 4 protein [Oceaniovalibus guishaninsula]